MDKTKIGLSVMVMTILMYAVAWRGGLLSTLFLAGYILMVEENEQLKFESKKATLIHLFFYILIPAFINIVTSIVNWIAEFFGPEAMLDNYEMFEFLCGINKFFGEVSGLISIVASVIFAIVTVSAFMKKDTKIPVIDDFIKKYI